MVKNVLLKEVQFYLYGLAMQRKKSLTPGSGKLNGSNKCAVRTSTDLKRICCLARGVVLLQVLKAALALATASFISSEVECGTLKKR